MRRLTMAALPASVVVLAACGGPQVFRAEVTSVDGDRVCIDDEWTGRECLGPDIPGTSGLAVGDCLDVTHAGESGRVIEVAPC